jgi:hypothetical protein
VISTSPSPFYATSTPIADLDVPVIIAAPAPIHVFRWDDHDGVLIGSELDPPGDHATLTFPSVFGGRWEDYRARARSGAEMPAAH